MSSKENSEPEHLTNGDRDSPETSQQDATSIEDMIIMSSVDEEPFNAEDSVSGDVSDNMSLPGDFIASDPGDVVAEGVSEVGEPNAGSDGDVLSDAGEDHEFEIIDELESDEEKDDQQELGDEKGEEDGITSESDFDDSELHAMLEKDVTKDSIREKEGSLPVVKHKIILKELETDPFDLLPPGWIVLTHNCGMPIYLHKETRVVTMAKPYSLGSASTRGHDIPISAIPCMQYKKQLEKIGENAADKKGENDQDDLKAKDVDGKEHVDGEKNGEEKDTDIKPDVQELNDSKVISEESSAKCPFTSPNKVWCVSEETTNDSGSAGSEESKQSVIASVDLKNPDTNKTKWVSTNGSFKRVSVNQNEETDSKNVTQINGGCPYAGNQSVTLSNLNRPKSPGGENIAVSLDTSSVLEKEEESELEEGEIEEEEEVKAKTAEVDTAKSDAEDENIDEDDDVLKEPSVHSKKYRLMQEEKEKALKNGTCSSAGGDQEVTGENTGVKVTQEEVTGNQEPSELVTSTTNRLAAIKRKLENLKNRHGGKQRKLEGGNGSAASGAEWQNEVNLTVDSVRSTHPVEHEDSNTPNDTMVKTHSAETKVKTAEERAKDLIINPDAVYTYCKRLFQFKTIEVKRYGSWKDRRLHLRQEARKKRPELPESTKLLTCPVMETDVKDGVKRKREFVLNPTGKSYLCILHEYMQRTMKAKPCYTFQELVNSKTPYGATVTINNVTYGTGYASSKKVAKQEAAKETLKIIIPDLFKKLTDQEIKRRSCADLSFFDEIEVTDPRVNELGNKVGQPGPYQILLECLKRNFGMGNTECNVTTQSLKNQKCEFSITVGKHTAKVVARNKRDGKQFASQAILAKLHPHVHSWGSLLRLYATNIEKPVEKVEQMNEIKTHTANKKVLESLREEMKKLHEQKEAIQSKGKITISSKDLPSKMSRLDL